jgi:hypothetical protein
MSEIVSVVILVLVSATSTLCIMPLVLFSMCYLQYRRNKWYFENSKIR